MRDRLRKTVTEGRCDGRLVWAVALLTAVLQSVIFVFFHPGYNYDVLMRYAPMADEFAAGNWYYAFHPKYGVFMSVAAGSLRWLSGMTGETACRMVSTFGWCLSAVPLWHFTRRSFGRGAAWLSIALLLTVPAYADYASAGLRDGVRILSYALIGYGFLFSAPWLAVGLFIQVTLRMDGIVVGCAVWAVWTLLSLWRRRRGGLLPPALALLSGLLADCAMVHAYTGYFLPSSSFIGLFGGAL